MSFTCLVCFFLVVFFSIESICSMCLVYEVYGGTYSKMLKEIYVSNLYCNIVLFIISYIQINEHGVTHSSF